MASEEGARRVEGPGIHLVRGCFLSPFWLVHIQADDRRFLSLLLHRGCLWLVSWSLPIFSFSKMESPTWTKNRRRKLSTTSWLGTGKFAGKARFSGCSVGFFVAGVFLALQGVVTSHRPLKLGSATHDSPKRWWCHSYAWDQKPLTALCGILVFKMKGQKNWLLTWSSKRQELRSSARGGNGSVGLSVRALGSFQGKS